MGDHVREVGELPHISVDLSILERLQKLSDETGAPKTWHRRKALQEYLDRNLPQSDQ